MADRIVLALDGHDGSGKTTLAKLIADRMDGVVLRPFSGEVGRQLLFAGEQKDVSRLVEIGTKAIETCLHATEPSRPLILDRGWVTVASFVADKSDFFSAWQLWLPTTLCWADLDTTMQRLQQRIAHASPELSEEDTAALDWHAHYLQVYHNLAQQFGLPVLRTDNHDINTCVSLLLEWGRSDRGLFSGQGR